MTDSVADNEDCFLNEREIAERWHVGYETACAAIHVFEKDPRFPKKDKLLGNKRFWPAIKAFMRWRYGLIRLDTSVLDGKESLHDAKNPRRSRVILAPKRDGAGSLLGGGSNGR